MKYHFEQDNGVLFIFLEGKLLGNQYEVQLLDQIEEHQEDGVKYAAIDVSQLELINSIGIGILMRILVKFRNKGGEVCLIKPSEQIRKLLIITKLMAIFSVVETKEEAIQCLYA